MIPEKSAVICTLSAFSRQGHINVGPIQKFEELLQPECQIKLYENC